MYPWAFGRKSGQSQHPMARWVYPWAVADSYFGLELQTKTWKAACYEHYNDAEIVTVKGELKYRFTCKKYVSARAVMPS
jgi:hypothetical protein